MKTLAVKLTLKGTFALRIKKDPDYRHWVLQELHKRQTDDERAEKKTRHRNALGFTQPDAPILTALAEKLGGGKKLTSKEEHELIWRLPKYWRQFIVAKLVQPPSAKDSGPTRKGPGKAASRASRRAA